MLTIVTKYNKDQHGELMADMHRMRHRVLVDQVGWEDLRKDDGFEVDEVDHSDTIYMISTFGDQGADLKRASGCVRLTPSHSLTLLNEVFPHLCDLLPLPTGEHIYDSSRIVVDPDTRQKGQLSPVAGQIMCAWYEAGLALGLECYTGVIETRYMTMCLAAGWKLRPIGSPHMVHGDEIIACEFPVTQEALAIVKSLRGVETNMLGADDIGHLRAVHDAFVQSKNSQKVAA
jgi:acyl-homoserine lactone synthase